MISVKDYILKQEYLRLEQDAFEWKNLEHYYLEHRFEFKYANPLHKLVLSQISIAYLKEWIKENKKED